MIAVDTKQAPKSNRSAANRRSRSTRSTNNRLAQRAQRLSDKPLRFVFSEEFDLPDAAARIEASDPVSEHAATRETVQSSSPRSGRSPLMGRLSEAPPLAPAQETDLFRRLNYLKYQAHCVRDSMHEQNTDEQQPDSQQLQRAEQLLEAADSVRDLLIRSNLRLVISIAKRFTSDSDLFEDLVSEGTIAMMNAVEHFDYSRGYRFSTYATQAVRRSYYRLLAKRAKRTQPLGGTTTEMLDSLPGPSTSGTQEEAAVESLRVKMRDILTVLDAREQEIIKARFGMKDLAPGQTLQKIADQLGVCKERVRQLERRAMNKLRVRAEELHLDEFIS